MPAVDEAEPPEYPEYILPHSDFGHPHCCGLFFPLERGDVADLRCNECGFVLRTVPVGDLRRVQDELQLSLDVASEKCPHCGSANLFPGFSRMGHGSYFGSCFAALAATILISIVWVL